MGAGFVFLMLTVLRLLVDEIEQMNKYRDHNQNDYF